MIVQAQWDSYKYGFINFAKLYSEWLSCFATYIKHYSMNNILISSVTMSTTY